MHDKKYAKKMVKIVHSLDRNYTCFNIFIIRIILYNTYNIP